MDRRLMIKPALFILIIFLSIKSINAQDYMIDTVIITPRQSTKILVEQPYSEPISLAPAISNISFEDIKKQGALNIIDAMNYVPGGLTETRGRQVKQFFSVRGQQYPYPAYAVDGVWQKEFEELPYFFSTSDIQEIEIIRSSAALLTGLSGLSGLINIKTRDYTSAETNVEMEYGTFNSLHSQVSTGNRIGRFGYVAGAGYDRTSGPSGRHAKEEMANLYTRFDWQALKALNVKANIFYLDGSRQMAIAQAPADPRYQAMIQGFDPYRALITNLKTVYRPNENLSTEVQIFYSRRNPAFIDEVKETTSNEKDYEYGFNLMQSVKLSGSNVLRFGGLYNRWIAPNGKRFYTGRKCDTETLSAVITDEQQIGPITLDAGVRLTRTYLNDYGAFNIEGDGAAFRNVTPIEDQWEPAILQGTLGATYRISNLLSLYLNSAAGQVKPRAGTLNEDLIEPSNETRVKMDLGLTHKLGNTGRASLATFGVFQKDAIALSGSTYLDAETNIRRELYLNRDQNQLGVEFDIISPVIFRYFKPFFNFTLMKSEMMNDEGNMVENKEKPALITSGGFYSEWQKFDLNLLFKYVSPFENERFAVANAGPQPLGDFFTTDMNAGYTFGGKIPARLYFKIRNLMDIRYSTVIGYPDFGRMIYAGVQVKFLKEKGER